MAEFRTVCFLFEIPPVRTYLSRYDMEMFIDNGIKVEVLDMSLLLHPGMYENTEKSNLLGNSEALCVHRIKSKKEYLEVLENLKDAFFWLTFPFADFTRWYVRKVSKYRYGYICNVDYVPTAFCLNYREGYWTKWSVERIKNAILARIPRRILPFRLADGVIGYSSEVFERMLRNTTAGKNTVFELTNTIDYCECRKVCDSFFENTNMGRYCLFLDQYLPYHPDGRESGYQLDAEVYYSEVQNFLNYIKKITGMNIVIAAHPKADYFSEHRECFNGFKIIQYKTAELVHNANLVVSHYSLSLNYVIFDRKPLILCYTSGMIRNQGELEDITFVGDSLKRRPINISEPYDNLSELVEEELKECYSKYDNVYRRISLPQDHPNRNLYFGDVMLKVMKSL